MRIIIPIKQVPETSNVKMDPETGTMVREGVESIINPLDLYSIETGIRLKEKYGGEIIVVSMGPKKAEEALKKLLQWAVTMECCLQTDFLQAQIPLQPLTRFLRQ